jgi:hypothetical protein
MSFFFCQKGEKQMAEASKIMPGDLPDWVQEAEKALANGETIDVPEQKEVTIKFGKGLVGEPFTSKNGHELVEVKIPNADKDDHTPWASFVISPKMIHDNKFGKGVWMKLPEDGTTKVSKPVILGEKEDGKKEWGNDVREVPNTELKEMMESYKTRERDSLLGNLDEKKQEAAKQPVKPKPEKAKNKGMEK